MQWWWGMGSFFLPNPLSCSLPAWEQAQGGGSCLLSPLLLSSAEPGSTWAGLHSEGEGRSDSGAPPAPRAARGSWAEVDGGGEVLLSMEGELRMRVVGPYYLIQGLKVCSCFSLGMVLSSWWGWEVEWGCCLSCSAAGCCSSATFIKSWILPCRPLLYITWVALYKSIFFLLVT